MPPQFWMTLSIPGVKHSPDTGTGVPGAFSCSRAGLDVPAVSRRQNGVRNEVTPEVAA